MKDIPKRITATLSIIESIKITITSTITIKISITMAITKITKSFVEEKP